QEQTGWFKEVRVKDLDSHSVRALLASRALLVKIKRDLENQIRGLLKNVGLVIGRAKFNVATLIHQRRLTPSCGGQAPTAERTVGPARMIAESLTPKLGIREQNLPEADICIAADFLIRSPRRPISRWAIQAQAWARR